MKKILMLSIIGLLCIQCNKNTTKNDKINEADVSKEETNKEDVNLKRYAWVDNFNIRNEANADAEIVVEIQPKDVLMLTGNTSEKKESIVLRGALYEDYWVEVKTEAGKQGWVFAGAIKKENEKKGNAEITDTKFSFENFGDYDLSKLTLISTEDSSGGDAEGETLVYGIPPNDQLDGPSLAITRTSLGEYGYSVTHQLRGQNGRVIKTRNFNFSNDVREISVEIIPGPNYPKRIYSKVQKINVSSFGLKSKPILVLGEWVVEDKE